MLNSTTFRVLHWTATVIMAVMIAMYCYLQHIQRLTVRDKLYEVRQLTPRTWLYITEYAEPDTTTGDVYRYFLASKFDGDPGGTRKTAHCPHAYSKHATSKS